MQFKFVILNKNLERKKGAITVNVRTNSMWSIQHLKNPFFSYNKMISVLKFSSKYFLRFRLNFSFVQPTVFG